MINCEYLHLESLVLKWVAREISIKWLLKLCAFVFSYVFAVATLLLLFAMFDVTQDQSICFQTLKSASKII